MRKNGLRSRMLALALALALTLVCASGAANAEGKTALTLSGLSVSSKTYDGRTASPVGALSAADASNRTVTLAAGDLVYRYVSTDAGGYDSADAPKNAGAYALTVSVREDHASYTGISAAIPFTIEKRALVVTPSAGVSRYAGCANPAFGYSAAGAVTGETPAFSGALSGGANASAGAGRANITLGTLALADAGSFAAANYTLSLAENADYDVVWYDTDAAAALDASCLDANGACAGSALLTAPSGYKIAARLDASSWDDSVSVSVPEGGGQVGYYLKKSGGENDGAISEQKLIAVLAADVTAPSVTLYSPAANAENASCSANQKILFRVSENVSAVSGKNVLITVGEATYEAAASAGDVRGAGTNGGMYIAFSVGAFTSGGTPLALTNGESYTVSVPAGAYQDDAGNSCGGSSASFRTVAADALTNPVLIVYWVGSGTVKTEAGETVVSGQALESGTKVVFSSAEAGAFDMVNNGAGDSSIDLTQAHAVSGDLEAYDVRAAGNLGGTVSIGGTAACGGTLSGSVSGASGSSGELRFTWIRVSEIGAETFVGFGKSDSTYTVSSADVGKTIRLEVTSVSRGGKLTAQTAAITKASYTGAVPKPVVLTLGETSVTLVETSGYEYAMDGGAYQTSGTFSSLTSGQTYVFTQRIAATQTSAASDPSEGLSVTTISPLTGTITISGDAKINSVMTASLTETNNSGELSYVWKRGETIVSDRANYTPQTSDDGLTLLVTVSSSVQTGTRTLTTQTISKAASSQAAPAAPTMALNTANSITLTAVNGCEYSLGGTSWQSTTTFHNLEAGKTYSFYQRYAATAGEDCSEASPAAQLQTVSGLSGDVMITGEARYGMSLTVSVSNTNNTGTLTYTWKRGTFTVGTGSVYAVEAVDIGNTLSVEITSSVQGGTLTRTFGTVQKARYFGDAPDAPTRKSRTTTKIVLDAEDGFEYSLGGETWQSSSTFSGLKAGKTYYFYQRYKATTTTEASERSEALKTATVADDSSSSDDAGASTSTTTPSTASGALYSYTLTGDNTRILYSVLQSLAKGNQTQDVTIKLTDAEFTFAKGTLPSTTTQLWYDFGVAINSCIHEQTARALGGEAYVATIHFNYSGALPAKASIRLRLGAAQAGKTLYYYKMENEQTLNLLQTAIVDSTGWATVSQESCSDYVFLDRDISAPAETPAPSVSPSLSPAVTSTPLITATDAAPGGMMGEGWFVAAIIILAVLLIIGGIWLYMKYKNGEDESDGLDDL